MKTAEKRNAWPKTVTPQPLHMPTPDQTVTASVTKSVTAKIRTNSTIYPPTVTLLHFFTKESRYLEKTPYRETHTTKTPLLYREKEGFEKFCNAVTAAQDPLFATPPADQPRKHSKPAPDHMPNWLKKHLEEKTGGFRAARWTRCPKCHAIILKGLDDDVAAWTVEADPTPITPRQEELCQWIGRQTYMVTMNPNRIELDRRTSYAIGKSCARPVVPAHRCGKRSNGFLLPPNASTQGQAENEHPPF